MIRRLILLGFLMVNFGVTGVGPAVESPDDIPERQMRVPTIIKSDIQKLRGRSVRCLLMGSLEGLLLNVLIEGDVPHFKEIEVHAYAKNKSRLPLHLTWAVNMHNSASSSMLHHLSIRYGATLW